MSPRKSGPFSDERDDDAPLRGDPDTDTAPRSEEGPPQTDRLAHAESGTSEFSRRSGGALSADLMADQFAELDPELETEHAQYPDELGVAFLTRATQDEPLNEQPPHEQARLQPETETDQEEPNMSVAKVTEITAESPESFDAAIREGIAAAGRSIENIRNVWIKDQQVIIRNNKPERYRVDMKVTFVLNDR